MTDDTRTNIGADRTNFIGRDEEIDELHRLFAGQTRLVTIVGTAGTGKTRLAREFARRCDLEEYAGGIWFCPLADARERDEVVSSVARLFNLSLDELEEFEERRDRVSRALAGRGKTLVILDNFEQIAETATSTIQPWLEATDEVSFLVTSRQRLHLGAERCFDLETLPRSEAVDLFADRARRHQRNFQVGEENREVVEQLVDHLDGIPLAVELAAARVRSMSPARMVDRISSRFRFLRASHRDSRPRQQTLENAFAWSWDQLDGWERKALVQCTAFRGGFFLEAGERVLDLEMHDEAPWIPDAIETLVDKSLLTSRQITDVPGETRFGMYESIREFARESEAADSELIEAARRRHAEYFVEQARRWTDQVDELEGNAVRSRMQLEQKNLYVAFERYRDTDPELAFELASLLDELFRHTEAAERRVEVVDYMVETSDGDDPNARATAYAGRANLRKCRGDLDGAGEDFKRAFEASAEAGNDLLQADLELRYGDLAREQGDVEEAVERFDQALKRARRCQRPGLQRAALAHLASSCADSDQLERARTCLQEAETLEPSSKIRRECQTHRRLAYAHYYLQNFERQRHLQEQALRYARRLDSPDLEGQCLQGLGDAAYAAGEYDRAVELYGQALSIHRRLGNRHLEGILLGNLGAALHRNDQLDEARSRYDQALERHRDTGAELYRVIVLHASGVLAHEQGQPQRAEEYYERALSAWETLEVPEDRAAVQLCASWLDLERRAPKQAVERLEASLEVFTEHGRESWRAVALATRGLAGRMDEDGSRAAGDDFREARQLADGTTGRESNLAHLILECVGDDDLANFGIEQATLRRSLYGRALLHTLETVGDLLENSPPPPSGSAESTGGPLPDSETVQLTVGPEARWCRLDDREAVDLRRRGAIRRVLQALADQRGSQPGDGLDKFELFEAGWPESQVAPKQAADRVYWAIRTLRDLGLRDVIITSDDGYYLDPDQTVIQRTDAPIPAD